ncbi:MAG TPA: CusA/CzcA family heavy metal efflux RND transporter [Candidatus Didemnitutus sp.]|nr:CusA/CzcA family heavy metal efflux RND transporter [Candidatus Didemnitutus sp.]
MIRKVIDWSLRNRFVVIAGFLAMMAWGVRALRDTPIDAIPDLSENQVIVYADWPGRSPQEVEDQITYPLSANLRGLTGVRAVRAKSMFGFSLLTVVFGDEVDNYFARTRVLERLNSLGDLLPAGISARLGPDATGLGWVYQYYLKVDPQQAPNGQGYDLGELRAVQDYYVRYQLAEIPGVAEVASIGGFVREWQVEVSALKLQAYGVTLGEVMDAVAQSSLNVGGKSLEENGAEFVVRGLGLIHSAADLEIIPVHLRGGVPVYLRDVARVHVGGDFRRGALDVNGHEVVGGTVVMRSGENAWRVIQDVKARIAGMRQGLPPGVTVEPFYDRSNLISRAVHTLATALTEEIILVTLAHILFLWHFRSILVVTLPLPAAVLVSFILMRTTGITSNIMSLTGIAISIGVLVDAGIVMTENVLRHCELAERNLGRRLRPAEIATETLAATTQVGRPVFFSMAIIVLAFVPVFLLSGQEGKLFHPLAYAKTYALVAATLLAVTLVPVACTLFVRGPFRSEDRNRLMHGLLAVYDPVLDWALRHRRTVLVLAGALLAAAGIAAFGLPRSVVRRLPEAVARHLHGRGDEFMPTLDEGSLLFMPTLLPSTSLTEVKRILAWQDRVLSAVPEVASAAGKLGRMDTATDPAPVEMIETTIVLRPVDQWRPGMTKSALVAELTRKMATVPGYVPGFLQPIENRLLMLSTGVRAQVAVKIFGDDLTSLQAKAFEVEQVAKSIPGATGVAVSRAQGKPYLEIAVDREALARFGLRTADVLRYVETGIGGSPVASTLEGRQRWPIEVRFERADREDIDQLGAILIPTPAGPHLPLSQLASIRRVAGPNEIESENGRLRVFVQANVSGRDLGGFVAELRERLARDITLAPGMSLSIGGQFENQEHARATLQLVLPLVVLVILVLLTLLFRSLAEASHVLLAVPFALTGGVFLQAALGYPFSVAVWVGYIALFGTAIQTGIVMVIYLEEAVTRKRAELGRNLTRPELIAAIKAGARLRLRPKVMTVATAVASLLPIFWTDRTGTEIMRPLATPVVGGMISSLVHILVVTPVLFLMLRERSAPEKPVAAQDA